MRRHFPLTLIAALVVTLVTALVAYSTYTTSKALEREALLQQRSRVRDVTAQLDAYLRLSEQVANTMATLVPTIHDQRILETFLQGTLSSTPPEFVYGVGVWYAPFSFDPATELVGPYAHRRNAGPSVLTYEWSTASYHYPSQPWYALGRSATARPAFTEPYFDVDYVYVSAIRAMTDARGALLGVVTVDVIRPQLQQIFARANVSRDEVFYATTRGGAIVAHPDEARMLAWARAHGRAAARVLDLREDDLRAYEAEQRLAIPRYEATAPVARAGWHVHVATDQKRLFAASIRVERAGLVVGLLVLALGVAVQVAYRRWLHANELAREVAAGRRVERVLRYSVKVRDEFLAIASHEIRTPLTPLMARLQAMQRQIRAGKPVEVARLDKAVADVGRLNALVNDLLDVSRIEGGRLVVRRERITLAPLVRDVVSEFVANNPDHSLHVETPADELWTDGDRVRLEQVVTNLVQNAVKYAPSGGQIRVALERVAGEGVLSVTDGGIGIPVDEQPHLFERYFRSRNAPVTSFGGLGLGLYISHSIVEQHGGRIWVTSTEGTGSTFYVALPLADANAQPVASAAPGGTRADPAAGAPGATG